jgi:hypothetical protein
MMGRQAKHQFQITGRENEEIKEGDRTVVKS